MEHITNKSLLSKSRVRGFIYIIAAFVALELFCLIFQGANMGFVRMVVAILSGTIFFVAFLALSNKQYKYYAQGAVIGWIVYLVFAVGLGIVFR